MVRALAIPKVSMPKPLKAPSQPRPASPPRTSQSASKLAGQMSRVPSSLLKTSLPKEPKPPAPPRVKAANRYGWQGELKRAKA